MQQSRGWGQPEKKGKTCLELQEVSQPRQFKGRCVRYQNTASSIPPHDDAGDSGGEKVQTGNAHAGCMAYQSVLLVCGGTGGDQGMWLWEIWKFAAHDACHADLSSIPRKTSKWGFLERLQTGFWNLAIVWLGSVEFPACWVKKVWLVLLINCVASCVRGR